MPVIHEKNALIATRRTAIEIMHLSHCDTCGRVQQNKLENDGRSINIFFKTFAICARFTFHVKIGPKASSGAQKYREFADEVRSIKQKVRHELKYMLQAGSDPKKQREIDGACADIIFALFILLPSVWGPI